MDKCLPRKGSFPDPPSTRDFFGSLGFGFFCFGLIGYFWWVGWFFKIFGGCSCEQELRALSLVTIQI